MHEQEAMTDADRAALERSLLAARPSPTQADRERMLYACGRAAGRASAARQTRWTAAAAVLMVGVTAAVAGRMTATPTRGASARPSPPLVASRQVAPPAQYRVSPNRESESPRVLEAHDSLAVLEELDQPTAAASASDDDWPRTSPLVEPVPTLTSVGQLDSLWNL